MRSVKHLVKKLQISMDTYRNALKMTNRGVSVVLQRKPGEIRTNYYNEHLLRAWGANIDVQYCLDPYACISYMVAYITKDEREMSHVLQAVSKECAGITWQQKMKNCAKAFLNAREISAQEAVYRLMSFPLFKCSFLSVFVPADLPKNRVAFLKPLSVIRTMEEEEEDIFMKNIIDRYCLRPALLKNMCLAHFAVWYVPVYGSQNKEDSESGSDEDQEGNQSNEITLNDGCSRMKKVSRPGVLRYHKKSQEKAPEEYFYAQLLLFLPWRDEQELQQVPSYEDHYNRNIDVIKQNKSELEHHSDIVESALQEFEVNGPPVHAYDDISPVTEQEQGDQEDEGVEVEEDSVLHPLPEHEEYNNSAIDSVPSRSLSYSIEMRPGVLPDEDYYSLVRSLNDKQRDVYQHVLNWCTAVSRRNKTGVTPGQMCLFVSGGAGTGKSHLISAVYQMATRKLSVVGDNPDDVRVTLAAPTGTAAHNISGITLHSTFLLPLGQTKSYVRLSDEKRNGLRSKAGSLDLLIIDEISMVSSDLLLQIHHRLSEIKAVDQPFGGVSVIAFGDLYQLPPVLQPFIFNPVKDPIASLSGSLWRTFEFKELDQIIRQREDVQFAQLLNLVRTASHTDEDLNFLKSREISTDSEDYPRECLHVFATNKAVDAHNKRMLDSLQTPTVTIVAVDRKPAALSSYDVSSDTRFTGGLPSVINLAVGAKVMLIRNIDVTDGLVNGAQGKVVCLTRSQNDVTVVLIHFNEPHVGAKTRAKSRHVTEMRKYPFATPIERTEISFTVNKKNKGLTITRCQFPLKLAWGCTIHKVQGLTVSKIVVSFQRRFNDGQAYVALSRAKSANGLYILDFESEKIRASRRVKEEMSFLSKERSIAPFATFFSDTSSLFLSTVNVRSLPMHASDLLRDPTFLMSDIAVLTETWLSHEVDINMLLQTRIYDVHRADKESTTGGRRSAGGVIVTVKKPSISRTLKSHEDHHLQALLTKIHGPSHKEVYVVAVYNSPDKSNRPDATLQQISTMLAAVPAGRPCIIAGDVNEDALVDTPGRLRSSLQSLGFHQQISKSTHRQGACLDHIYTRNITCVATHVSGTYYSDHDWATCRLKF